MNAHALLAAGLSLFSMFTAASVGVAREWADTSGRNKAEADFVELLDDSVRLKNAEGRLLSVPLSRLRPADQLFAIRQSVRLQDEVPMLNMAAQGAADDVLKFVQESSKAFSDPKKIDDDDLYDFTEKLQPMVLQRLEAVAVKGQSQRSVVPAVIRLLKDENAAVRAVGVSVMNELGVNASAAGPALAELVGDPQVGDSAAFAVSRMAEQTDTPIVGLVPLIVGDDAEAAQAALEVVSQGFIMGPRTDAALLTFAKAAQDEKLNPAARARAVQAIDSLLGDSSDPLDRVGFRRAQDDVNLYRLLEAEISAQRTQRQADTAKLCEDLAPLIASKHGELQQAVVLVIAEHAPQHLAKTPGDTLVRLLTLPEGEELEERDRQELLVYRLTELAEAGELQAALSPAQMVQLLRNSENELSHFVHLQLRGMGADAQKLLPELAKLAEDDDVEVRGRALAMLSGGAFATGEDLSALPAVVVKIEANAQGATAAIHVDGKQVAGVAKLTDAIVAATPAPAADALTAEQILAKAIRDEEEEIRRMALMGLANMGTPSSLAVIRDTSRKALARETREMATYMLERLEERRGDEFDGGDSPFRVAAPAAEAREIAVKLSLDRTLRFSEAAAVLKAIGAAKVRGVRLVAVAADGKAAGEMHLQPVDRDRRGFRDAAFEIHLARESGRPAPRWRMESESMRAIEPPSLESLRFLFAYLAAERYDRYDARDFGESPRLGADALPLVAAIHGDSGALCGDVADLLAAIGIENETDSRAKDLVQWIRLNAQKESAGDWFLKVVPVRE